jgi:hypothetical protein
MASTFYKGTAGVLLVYAINDNKTFGIVGSEIKEASQSKLSLFRFFPETLKIGSLDEKQRIFFLFSNQQSNFEETLGNFEYLVKTGSFLLFYIFNINP